MFERMGFRTSGLCHVPLKKAFQGIRNAGYHTVEFCLEHPESSAAGIAMAGLHGLEVSAVSYHGKRDTSQVRLSEGFRAIDLAVQCGISTVVFGSPFTGREEFIHQAGILYEKAVDAGVLPAWETEPGTVLDSTAEFMSMIIPLGTRAGMNMDAGHLHLQGCCTSDCVSSLKGRIHHVHVEGMFSDEHTHLIPGTGDLNWTELLDGLNYAGYRGPLTIDLFNLPSEWEVFLEKARIALKDIVSYYLRYK